MTKKRRGMVPWKQRRDDYDDDADSDFELRGPRLVGAMQEPEFIKRDETNADACRKLGIRWW